MIASTNHHPDRVAKNTTFLTAAQGVQKVLSFFYFAYLAAKIGDIDVGKYVWVLSFTGIFALLMEFGLSRVLTREVAKNYEKARQYLANVLGVKILLAIVTVILAVITVNALNREPLVVTMVYLACAVIVLDTFTQTFYSIFRAFQILKYEALGIVIYQALILGGGLLVIKMGWGLNYLIAAVLLGSLFNFFYSFILLSLKGKIKPAISFDKQVIKPILFIAIPFALYGIFYKVSISIDSVMLGVLASDRFVGWYAVASKITLALTFIPGAFATSLFPAFAHYFVSSKENLKKTFENAMFYLMVISLPLSVGIFTLADKIILRVWGPVFEASIVSTQIIISGLLFIFLNFPVGNLLNACNKQVVNTVNMAITMAFNVILNFILIPKFDYVGASISFLASSVLLIVLGLPWVSKIIDYNKEWLLKKLGLVVASSLLMGLVIVWLKSTFNFLLVIPIAVLVYFGALFLFRGLRMSDIKGFIRSVMHRNGDIANELQKG
ncbi:flippase [Patescibacteria group bacterium]|nr:flippase [Patescibacteria group bacterium]